ncbi:hypothetical protein [Pediococcus pentosaceus]|uniref:hypothetical protein n=1 Tax=Pediococcus pentosaceus TaxID=1255 RepID=UPI0020C0E33F|nr:hypothetical protein [Pediococcus pentosaceus]
MDDTKKLEIEKKELVGTIYHDFVKSIHKNSIYKSIQLFKIDNNTAYYECEPYDKAYRCSTDEQFFETCKKLERAFKKYYKKIFEKYGVNAICVEIYNEYSCDAGLSVYDNGLIETSNF